MAMAAPVDGVHARRRGVGRTAFLAAAMLLLGSLGAPLADETDPREAWMPPAPGEYRHAPPSLASLRDDPSIHPELRDRKSVV